MASKTIIITGASNGIGAASVRRFYQEGYKIATMDAVPLDADLAQLVVLHQIVDIRCGHLLPAMFAAAAVALGTPGMVTAVFANAGVIDGEMVSLENESVSEIDRVLSTNVNGTTHTCRAAIPLLQAARKSGHPATLLVTCSICSFIGKSICATQPNPGGVPYFSSKGFDYHLVQLLAGHLRRDNVRVLAVGPFLVDTPLVRYNPEMAIVKDLGGMGFNPSGALIPPDVIAATAYHLVDNKLPYMQALTSGTILVTDSCPPDGPFEHMGVTMARAQKEGSVPPPVLGQKPPPPTPEMLTAGRAATEAAYARVAEKGADACVRVWSEREAREAMWYPEEIEFSADFMGATMPPGHPIL